MGTKNNSKQFKATEFYLDFKHKTVLLRIYRYVKLPYVSRQLFYPGRQWTILLAV